MRRHVFKFLWLSDEEEHALNMFLLSELAKLAVARGDGPDPRFAAAMASQPAWPDNVVDLDEERCKRAAVKKRLSGGADVHA